MDLRAPHVSAHPARVGTVAEAMAVSAERAVYDWRQAAPSGRRIIPRADRHFRKPSADSPACMCAPSSSPSISTRATVYDLALALRRAGGRLELADSQAKAIREYLLRGGFFMCDDFWGETNGRSSSHA